jgi:hypothetical protein
MSTQHSGIRKLFAAKKPAEESIDASQPRFVTRLGDVKIETKLSGKSEVIDGSMVTDRFEE